MLEPAPTPVSDGAIVGVVNLRHSLTDALRREGGNMGYIVRLSARGRGFARELLRRTLPRWVRLSLLGIAGERYRRA